MINRMIIHLILALVNRLSLSLTCVCYSFGQVLDIYRFVILNDSFYFCHFRIELTLLIHLVHEIHNYVGLRAFLLLNATYMCQFGQPNRKFCFHWKWIWKTHYRLQHRSLHVHLHFRSLPLFISISWAHFIFIIPLNRPYRHPALGKFEALYHVVTLEYYTPQTGIKNCVCLFWDHPIVKHHTRPTKWNNFQIISRIDTLIHH